MKLNDVIILILLLFCVILVVELIPNYNGNKEVCHFCKNGKISHKNPSYVLRNLNSGTYICPICGGDGLR